MESKPSRSHCIRCGECCLKSSPTLQAEDLHFINEGLIQKHDLYAIRAGELVYDNIHNRLKISETEFIKLKEKGVGQGCFHYDDKSRICKIYENRPSQCSAFTCWDEKEIVRVYESPRLERKSIIKDHILLGLIEQHEKRCRYRTVDKLVRQIETDGAKAVEEILSLLRFDHELRPFVSEKTGVALDEMDLVFGRPLTETIAMFGLQVISEPDGSFFLTVEPKR